MKYSENVPVEGRAARTPAGIASFVASSATGCGNPCRVRRWRLISCVVCALVIFLFGDVARAQQAEKDPPPGVGNLDRAEVNGDTLTLHAGADTIVVQVVEPNILRVHYRPQGQTSPPTPVLDPNRVWSNDTTATIDTDSDPLTISTDKMIVKISTTPLRFAIYDVENHLLMQEPAQGGVYPGGLRFACKPTDPFFGIDGTAMPGKIWMHARIFVLECGARAAWSSAGRQGDGGAPLAYTPAYGLLVDSDGGDFNIAAGMLQFSGGSRNDVRIFRHRRRTENNHARRRRYQRPRADDAEVDAGLHEQPVRLDASGSRRKSSTPIAQNRFPLTGSSSISIGRPGAKTITANGAGTAPAAPGMCIRTNIPMVHPANSRKKCARRASNSPESSSRAL